MAKKTLAFLLVVALAPAAALADPITSLFVFGDSLSDQGNAFVLTGGFPPPPYAGRASNGPVAVEQLAGQLGVPLAPAALGGTNYAVVGAATGPVVIPGSSPPFATDNSAAVQYSQPALFGTGIINQVLFYLPTGPVLPADSDNSLFVVWGGANDLFIDTSPASAANAIANLATAISLLHGNGARRFLVPNLPDLSLTPFGRGLPAPLRAGVQALSMGFNTGLEAALDQLDLLLPGIDITRFDTFGLLTAIADDPLAFGFANAVGPCLTAGLGGGGTACADPDSYVFWDSVHPTTAAHRVLGNQFAAAVPEPGIVALLGVGLVLGAVARRRRLRGLAARGEG